jgi:hypothetical protein
MASDNTTTELILRTSISETDNAHSWFRSTPRESRNEIYDLIFQEKEHPLVFRINSFESYYFKTRTTLPRVRLVSKSFKLEYDERDKHHLPKNHFRVCQVSLKPSPHYFGLQLRVPALAVRTTVLHLDLVCCQDTQDPQQCLVPASGPTEAIGGGEIRWWSHGRHFAYNIADMPLLESAYFHVRCAAKAKAIQRAADLPPLPTGDPSPEEIPTLVQISKFHRTYVPTQEDSVRALEQHKSAGKFHSQSGRFAVHQQTKAIWTRADGWDNEAKVHSVRRFEMTLGDHDVGEGIVLF